MPEEVNDEWGLYLERDGFSDDEGESATEWTELPPEREFFANPYDPPVKALIQEMSDHELIARPSFQRYAVWDDGRKSRFVESILLNIPIPTLFFAEDDDKTKVVVDGQQRLLALKGFVENKFSLRSLEVLAPLNGKQFDELTERQQRIFRNRTLRCLVISARSDSEIRFQVFERLNQGGIPLNAQEVRHCVYRGPFNDLLHKLVKDPTWLGLLGAKDRNERMTDCELLLRFFALRNSLPDYAPPLKTLLNNFMRRFRHADEGVLRDLQAAFSSAISAVRIAFPANAFKRVYKTDNGPAMDRSLNRAVFDVQMLVMEQMDLEWIQSNVQRIRDRFTALCLEDAKFADAVSRATADKARMSYRLRRWKEALEDLGAIVPVADRIPRAE